MEHDSILLPLQQMHESGRIELTVVGAQATTGAVTVESYVSAVQPNTCLVTLMLANNETGVLQPVAEIMGAIRRLCEASERPRIVLHTDAAQVV